jgi:hypothetical protein
MARMSDVAANTWTDPSTEYGEPYRYVVLRIVKLDDRREAESEPSAEFAITPVDTFPPAAPADLRAAAGPESIELAWGRSTAPDLAAYRIYRAVDGGAMGEAGGHRPDPHVLRSQGRARKELSLCRDCNRPGRKRERALRRRGCDAAVSAR